MFLKIMKKTIFVFLLLHFSLAGFAQSKKIDIANMLCSYVYEYLTDTLLEKQQRREDLLYLQIGNETSKCYSYYTYQCDSLMVTPNGDKLWDGFLSEAIRKGLKGKQLRNAIPHRRMSATIYKNYPQEKVTVTDFLLGQYYLYEDSLNSQEWNIENDSVKFVLGHECQKATCDFRGRQWTAWFALDVPINDGPWKFCGLPGLIMEVYDKGNQYYFSINGIQKVNATPITFGILDKDFKYFQKTNRKDFLSSKYKYLKNQNSINEASTGISLGIADEALKYDLIERE